MNLYIIIVIFKIDAGFNPPTNPDEQMIEIDLLYFEGRHYKFNHENGSKRTYDCFESHTKSYKGTYKVIQRCKMSFTLYEADGERPFIVTSYSDNTKHTCSSNYFLSI